MVQAALQSSALNTARAPEVGDAYRCGDAGAGEEEHLLLLLVRVCDLRIRARRGSALTGERTLMR